MPKLRLLSQCLSLLLFLQLFHVSHSDVGTASQYRPPYLPTACYGGAAAQFPPNQLFGSAGEGVWDNGAACGRQYLVRCIGGPVPNSCIPGEPIRIKIVDRAKTSVSRPSQDGATVVLSTSAFGRIAKPSVAFINIDFRMF